MSGIESAQVHVCLYVRSLSPRGSRARIESIVDRLDALVETGAVGEYDVLVTGKEIPATVDDAVTEFGASLCTCVAVVEEWARRNGRAIESAFERRTVYSQFTGENHDAVVMPTLLMAEYEGGDLRHVAPCVAEDERVSIADRLDVLSAGLAGPDAVPVRQARGNPPWERVGPHH